MNNEKGFSLLEILVAFAILALALGLLLRIFSGGVNTAITADGYTAAIQIAESLLARTGVETPLQEGEGAGMEGDRYFWRVSVSPYQSAELPETLSVEGIELMRVDVQVSWNEGQSEPRELKLTTLKLVNKVP